MRRDLYIGGHRKDGGFAGMFLFERKRIARPFVLLSCYRPITGLSRFPFGPFNQMRRAHMQQKIIFKSKGLNCSGLFYLPDNYSATDDVKLPAIAMAHGMGTTKEVGLPQFAERFADAGFAVL